MTHEKRAEELYAFIVGTLSLGICREVLVKAFHEVENAALERAAQEVERVNEWPNHLTVRTAVERIRSLAKGPENTP